MSSAKNNPQKVKKVFIELDGHQWHERTLGERRYEKKRDRYIQSRGFSIFHYTGHEIVKDPIRVAGEVISFVIGGTNVKTTN